MWGDWCRWHGTDTFRSVVGNAIARPAGCPASPRKWRRLGQPLQLWITGLVDRVAQSESKLGTNSTNSSKPPSSDPPSVKKRRRPRSGRKAGGQPGHPGHFRPLVPPERVNETRHLHPDRCRGCGRDISANPGKEFLHHQVAEIPAIEPHITDYLRHRACCPDCGTVTTAPLPSGIPTGVFGPNLRALLAVLSGRFRMSRREVVDFCREALGFDVSVGCVDNLCRGMGDALCAPVAEVLDHIQEASVVHPDESGWKQKGIKHWIWTAVTVDAAYFRIAKSRGADVAREMLGDHFKGFIVTDRWSAYTIIPAKRRQICWAHLKRDFQKIVDRGGAGRPFGDEGLRLTKVLFSIWQSYEREEISRREMQRRMVEVETSFGVLFGAGGTSSDKKVPGFCKKLLDLGEALFLFVRVLGVEPTNNRAERALRPVVLWRKGSFGTWSNEGSRFVERMMTVVMTRRLRGHSVLSYLKAVCAAQDRRDKIPSVFESRARDRPASIPA